MPQKKTDWFMKDRFGMFIHWGLYSIPARGEWVRSQERISTEDYRKYFDAFDPKDYRPREWARLAREAGMRYAVLTAKHHDGFCLFDSGLTDYKATRTKAGRDLVREFLEAFRAEGLKVGLYYSLLDWHHPDYPAWGDPFHPMRGNEAFRDRKQDFGRYLDYFHGQVRELLTNYGKIDVLWLDFSYKGRDGDMAGETWRAAKLIRMVRGLQPDILVNNRLGGDGTQKELTYGDFTSPEQSLPRAGIADGSGNPVPWEACITLNDHWGYCAADHNYKQPKEIVRALAECAGKNGNLILNVGPDARGNFPGESVEILKKVGAWMEKNGESIYGCTAAPLPKPDWGRYTKKGNRLYAHLLDRGIGPVVLEGLSGKIAGARLLSDGSEVDCSLPWNVAESGGDAFLNLRSSALPCEADTVVELALKE